MDKNDAELTRRRINYFGWAATLLLILPVLGLCYVSVALVYEPAKAMAKSWVGSVSTTSLTPPSRA